MVMIVVVAVGLIFGADESSQWFLFLLLSVAIVAIIAVLGMCRFLRRGWSWLLFFYFSFVLLYPGRRPRFLCVQAGRKEPNFEIGRYLSDTISAIPYISPDEFDKLFEDNMQDMLLVMYLSSLMRTQLAIADKLGTQLLPIL